MVGRNPKCSNCGPLQRHACAECCLCKPDVVEDGEVVRNGSFCQTCRNKHKRLPSENLCRCTLKRICPQHLGAGGGFCLECRKAKMACNDCCRCTAIAFCPKCYGKVRQLRSKRRAEVGCGCQGAGSCESCAACECTPRRVPCFYCGAVNNFREACGVLQRFIYTNTFAAADAMRAIQAISIEIRQPRPDILKAITDALSKPRDDAPETLLPPVMRNPRHQLQGMTPLLPAPRPKRRAPKRKKLNPLEATASGPTPPLALPPPPLHPSLADYANASATLTSLLAIEGPPPHNSSSPDLLSLEVLPDPMGMDDAPPPTTLGGGGVSGGSSNSNSNNNNVNKHPPPQLLLVGNGPDRCADASNNSGNNNNNGSNSNHHHHQQQQQQHHHHHHQQVQQLAHHHHNRHAQHHHLHNGNSEGESRHHAGAIARSPQGGLQQPQASNVMGVQAPHQQQQQQQQPPSAVTGAQEGSVGMPGMVCMQQGGGGGQGGRLGSGTSVVEHQQQQHQYHVAQMGMEVGVGPGVGSSGASAQMQHPEQQPGVFPPQQASSSAMQMQQAFSQGQAAQMHAFTQGRHMAAPYLPVPTAQMQAFPPGATSMQIQAFSQGAAAHMQHLAAALHRSPPPPANMVALGPAPGHQQASSPPGLTLDELQERMDRIEQYPLEPLEHHGSPIKNETANVELCGQ